MEQKIHTTPNNTFYVRRGQLLSECLQQMFSTADENQAIDTLLCFIGRTFGCERVYIFENKDVDNVCNTYEWCAEGVAPQKELLQTAPYAGVASWYEMFDKEGALCISDIEAIRETYPLTYGILKPQDIRSLIVGPIPGGDRYVGFIGADNPGTEMPDLLLSLVRVIGYFVSVLIKRRDLTNKLKKQSYIDPMTGALNRAALDNFFTENKDAQCIGLVYGDISGLKQVNDAYGHAAGDEMIMRCYRSMATSLPDSPIFRVGGDEFVAICLNLTQSEFTRNVQALRRRISHDQYHMAIGSAWTDTHPSSFDDLLKKADKEMYEDKESYYNSHDATVRQARERRKTPALGQLLFSYDTLPALMANKRGCYLCIGDHMGQRYFVSDGLKDKFGFSHNLVGDFWNQWEARIVSDEHKRRFRKIIEEVLREKKTSIDFEFDMQDRQGNLIKCKGSGLVQWDEGMSEPILFMSCAQIDEHACLHDPITGLPMRQSVADALDEVDTSVSILVFKLNGLHRVDALRGRDFHNRLVKRVVEELRARFQSNDSVTFHRMNGAKFIGVFTDRPEMLQKRMETISEVVGALYKRHRIAAVSPVTFLSTADNSCGEDSDESTQTQADFETSDAHLSGLKWEIDMESALIHDIGNHMTNFRVVLQPMVCIRTQKIVGAEVLLRWTFNGDEVAPSVFVPVIERRNLMGVVGQWVLEQTLLGCRGISVYRPDLVLSFNISCQEIQGDNFGGILQAAIQKYGVNGSCIVTELQQSLEDKAPMELRRYIEACEEIGAQIALDNFGNGYCTLGLLLEYSAQFIKINRPLLRSMTASREREQLIRGLVHSCHKLGKTVCAVGVETEEELAVAKRAGCDWVQGFYFHYPMNPDDLYQTLVKER